MGTVGAYVGARAGFAVTARGGRRRGTRGEVRTLRTDERRAPTRSEIMVENRLRVACSGGFRRPVRVEMQSEVGSVPVAEGGGGTGGPEGRGTDAVGSAITAGPATGVGLVGEGGVHRGSGGFVGARKALRAHVKDRSEDGVGSI